MENGDSERPLGARQARVWGAGGWAWARPQSGEATWPSFKAGPGKTHLSWTDGEAEAQRGQGLVRDTADWWQAGSFLTTAWRLKISVLQFQGSFETPSTYGPGPRCG